MGFAIALALGASGIAATAIGGAINLAAGLGVSYAAQRLAGKKSSSASQVDRGASVTLQLAADAPRAVILGEAATAGSLIYFHTEGATNNTQCRVFALADHECDGLTAVYVNGARKTVGANGHVAGFSGKLRVRFYSGAPGQVADPDVIAGSGGRWTATHKGTGVCYAVVWADYDEKLFPNDFPSLIFVVRGAKLLDPRTGVTAYTDNWGVCVYNLLRGIRQNGLPLAGLNAPVSSIRHAEAVAACNVSDEMVSREGAAPERRYRAGAVLYSTETARQQIETLLAAGGDVIECGGIYRIFAEVAQAPVAYLTDADFILGEPFRYSDKAPRSRLVNTIEASWLSPLANFTSSPLPPRSSSADVAADRGRLSRTLDLSAVPSFTQAQRLMEIARRQARRQGTASCVGRAALCVLEPGDWVAISSDRYGWVDRQFVVMAAPQSPGLTVSLSLAEVDPAIDDWAPGDEIASNEAANLATGGPGDPALSGLSLSALTWEITTGGQVSSSRPALKLQWTPVDDLTTVQIKVQYRPAGTTDTPLEVVIQDVRTGAYTWVTGVQGGTAYEARVLPVTVPARQADWSPWVQTPTAAAPQVVPVAGEALYIDPVNIPPAQLNAQEAHELRLVTETEAVFGSLSEQIARAIQESNDTAHAVMRATAAVGRNRAAIAVERRERLTEDLALAEQITTAVAQINDNIAFLEDRVTSVATESGATASAVTQLTTTVNGNTLSVQELRQSVDGLSGRWGVAINASGHVVGLVQLDAGAVAGSAFTVVANKFKVALPGVVGGTPVDAFAIGQSGGVTKIVFKGDMYGDGSIDVRAIRATSVTALSANFGTAQVTGVLSGGPNGRLVIDFNSGRIRATAGA